MTLGLLTFTLTFVSAVLAACALVAFARALRLRARGVPAEGRVVGHAHEPDGSRVAAVVEYVVGDVAYRVRSSMLEPHTGREPGERLSVMYLPDDPAHARVAHLGDLFTPALALSAAFVVIGALAAALAYAMIALR